MRTQLASNVRGQSLLEKEPHVAAHSGSGSFQRAWDIHPSAGLQNCDHILLPAIAIEVRRQEKACFVQQHRINPHDEIAPRRVVASQMPANRFVSDLIKATIWTLRAFNSGLFADATHPFVRACWGIPGLASLAILEAARIDVLPASK